MPHKWESLRPARFPLPDHDDDGTSKHCKDCLVTRLHRPYIALPLWFYQNHVTEIDDSRYHIWLFGAVGRLIIFISSSQNHGCRLWVSLTYEKIIYPTGRKSNRTQHQAHLHQLLRACRDSLIIYLRRATSSPNFAFQRVREATSFI